jgi:NAD(P)-dependent dehydrogenase (short-subunit alcohol dehydrogenase family)
MTASLAAEQGYAVCVNYLHHPESANQIVQTITQKGGKAIAVAADVSCENDVVQLFQTVDNHLGTVTALVNNAGILEQQRRVEQMDADRLNRIFAINITGSFLYYKQNWFRNKNCIT